MTKAQHTPGPWKWNFASDFGKDPWLIGSNGEGVLRYGGCGTHEIEATAPDAHLIAAAPELLWALEELDTEITFSDSHSPYYTFNEDTAQRVRAAIVKATG